MNFNLENIKEILDCYFSEEKAAFDGLHRDNLNKFFQIEELDNDTDKAIEQIELLPFTFSKNPQALVKCYEPKEHIFYNLLWLKKDYEKTIKDKVQFQLNLEKSKFQQSHL